MTPHPTYNMFRFTGMDKAQAREKLGLGREEKLLLFFGFVRKYKGLSYLLEALPAIIAALDDVRLLIVGDFDGDRASYQEVIDRLGIGAYITIVDGYIPDREVEPYFAACDLVVLPYESATQSGVVQIAYGFEKPVVVTDVGGLPDIVTDGETGYVVEAQNPGALADAVVRYFTEGKQEQIEKNIADEAYRFSWDRMGEIVDGFFGEKRG